MGRSIELLGTHRYLIPVSMQLPKVAFSWVDGWSTGPPSFGASHI